VTRDFCQPTDHRRDRPGLLATVSRVIGDMGANLIAVATQTALALDVPAKGRSSIIMIGSETHSTPRKSGCPARVWYREGRLSLMFSILTMFRRRAALDAFHKPPRKAQGDRPESGLPGPSGAKRQGSRA